MRGVALRGVTLLHIRGVPIEAHWSLPLFAVWLPASFATLLRDHFRHLSAGEITAVALISVVLYFVSLLLHELGHSLQARREGLQADRITLWGLGGLAWSSGSPRSRGADYRIVAAGPLVSLVEVVVFALLAWLSREAALGDAVVALLIFQAVVNAVILGFNLLPVYPLDGGQLMYAALWRLRGHSSAAAWTTRIGTAVALLVLGVGVIGPFLGWIAPPLTAGRGDGASFMFAGFILLGAALLFRPPSRVLPPVRLRGRQVGDLLHAEPLILSPETTNAAFVDQLRGLPRARGFSAGVYVVAEEGRVIGLVSPGLALDAVDAGDGDGSVASTMIVKEDAVMLTPEMSIEEGLAALSGDQQKGVVVADGRALGILRRSDLAAAVLEAHEAPNGSVVPAVAEPLRVSW